MILVLAPHREGIEQHEVLRVPRRNVVFNVQLAIEIALVLGFRQDSDFDVQQLQAWGRKYRTQHPPRVRIQLIKFELMASSLDTAEPPGVHNRRSTVPLEFRQMGRRHIQRALRCSLHVVQQNASISAEGSPTSARVSR